MSPARQVSRSAHAAPRGGGSRRVALVLVGVLATSAAGWTAWSAAADRRGVDGAEASPTSAPAAVSPSETLTQTPTETPTETPTVEATPTPTPEPSFDLTAHSTTDPASIWVVVNKQHPIDPLRWEPDDLTSVGGLRLRAEAAEHLQTMLDDAAADGVRIGLRTGYRSYSQQAGIRADVEARRGWEHAEKYSARPGYSEHQTGLSLDVDSTSQPGCGLQLCFGDTVEGQWVAEHADEYGFLIRYTDDNADVTGFSGEPWHLRYVGTDLVEYMADQGLGSLEETFGVSGGTTYAES